VSRWPQVTIGEVADPVDRSEAPIPGVTYRQIGVHLWGEGAYQRESMDGAETKYKTLNRVEAGDIIVNKIWARNGSVSVVSDDLAGCYCSGEFPLFQPRPDRLDPRWFYWITKTRWFWERCDEQSRGTSGKNRLRPQKFLEIPIPLAPIEEQRRVVRRIEQLAALHSRMSRLMEGSRSESLVLQAAHVRTVIESLPGHRVSLQEVTDVRGGMQRTPERTPGANPVRYLTVAHVHRDSISTADPRYFEVTPRELEKYQLKPGDVLIIEGNGSATEIGRAALFRGEVHPCVHQNHVIRLRPDTSVLRPEFLNAYLNSPTGRDAIRKRSRTTSGLLGLSVGRIREIELVLPSLKDQDAALKKLTSIAEKVDRLGRRAFQLAAMRDVLMPSALGAVLT
jgi:type I restriction enzyme S subunit